MKVVGGETVEVNNKSKVPTMEKKVQDINDSTERTTTGVWQDSADYDIGDKVLFKLEGTIADNFDDYDTYYYAFHDKEDTGLNYSEKLYATVLSKNANGDNHWETIDSSCYTVVTNPDDGDSFDVIFTDLKKLKNTSNQDITVTKDCKIVFEYYSKLTGEANIGNQGNVNSAKLEFSNNPYEEQEGGKKPSTGETPEDKVIVFTYKVVVNKYANEVDKEGNNKLAGAEFTLEKKILVQKGVTEDKNQYEYRTIDVGKSDDGKTFTFSGLDDGEYRLTETKTPSGYNTISPMTFTVSASHKAEWDADTTKTSVLESLTGEKISGDIEFTPSLNDGSLTSNVVNKKGTVLPSTGGIGTTVFYVTGAILMLGAGILLVSRKRVSK